jgi:hypothetical protein
VTQHDLEMLNQQALSNTTVVHPAAYPALVTCPISTGGVTRRVRLVRGWGGGVSRRATCRTRQVLRSPRSIRASFPAELGQTACAHAGAPPAADATHDLARDLGHAARAQRVGHPDPHLVHHEPDHGL